MAEKTEIQRHYVMYYEMSYGLNIEMHKQSEIVKRLNSIIAQILPFLSQEVSQLGEGVELNVIRARFNCIIQHYSRSPTLEPLFELKRAESPRVAQCGSG